VWLDENITIATPPTLWRQIEAELISQRAISNGRIRVSSENTHSSPDYQENLINHDQQTFQLSCGSLTNSVDPRSDLKREPKRRKSVSTMQAKIEGSICHNLREAQAPLNLCRQQRTRTKTTKIAKLAGHSPKTGPHGYDPAVEW
jgi:hypothetical protein